MMHSNFLPEIDRAVPVNGKERKVRCSYIPAGYARPGGRYGLTNQSPASRQHDYPITPTKMTKPGDEG
ncbi:hypothetical protein N7517_004449 [Penicillium concentricum]|uniref:Uncharacterized protein n=1 Tax=Penicillium concentricum TaxID=293559 RepID=A0A9W9V862_9EURO|nr:uncharacterized protein N7517_004449 [Penicillium concentricum]KAJ5372443.1 hypothetical protein N7517_004449 [Penicillium concentricum]